MALIYKEHKHRCVTWYGMGREKKVWPLWLFIIFVVDFVFIFFVIQFCLLFLVDVIFDLTYFWFFPIQFLFLITSISFLTGAILSFSNIFLSTLVLIIANVLFISIFFYLLSLYYSSIIVNVLLVNTSHN